MSMNASAKKNIVNTQKPRESKAHADAKLKALLVQHRTVFLPTLLSDPFGEVSPELCWEWSLVPARLTIRLTQFGWNASAFIDGIAICHFTADSLQNLRDNVIDSPDLSPAFADMARSWVLAYEVAGP